MIRIENVETYGWEAAIRGMRNPKNSWSKSDSRLWESTNRFESGESDLALMQTLANAGTDHGKFLRMITITLDITAPLYWWKEYDTYKVGTVANSCSTMHKIADKEFVVADFSVEHLIGHSDDEKVQTVQDGTFVTTSPFAVLRSTIGMLNECRDRYSQTKDKRWWWQMIQLLPSSYNQRRTVQLNYAVLRNMYHARKAHKLDEWRNFCEWVETLPYAKELIVGGKI